MNTCLEALSCEYLLVSLPVERESNLMALSCNNDMIPCGLPYLDKYDHLQRL